MCDAHHTKQIYVKELSKYSLQIFLMISTTLRQVTSLSGFKRSLFKRIYVTITVVLSLMIDKRSLAYLIFVLFILFSIFVLFFTYVAFIYFHILLLYYYNQFLGFHSQRVKRDSNTKIPMSVRQTDVCSDRLLES